MVKTNTSSKAKAPTAAFKTLNSVLPARLAREFAKEIVTRNAGGDKFIAGGVPKLPTPATAGGVRRSIVARQGRSQAKDIAAVYDRLPPHVQPKFLAELTRKALTPKILKTLSASGNEIADS